MADGVKTDRVKYAEDRISLFLNGGACASLAHPPATELDKLIMLKQLRLALPHQSTHPNAIEVAIRAELKKKL